MRTIALITTPCVGGTFMAWTMEYLAGHSITFNVSSDEYVDLTDIKMPFKTNFHNLRANYCDSMDQIRDTHSALSDIQTNAFGIIYFHPFMDDANKEIQYINDNSIPSLVVQLPPPFVLYLTLHTQRHNGRLSDDIIINYFREDEVYWKTLGLTEIYDKREFVALNLRPFDFKYYTGTRDIQATYTIMAPDVWFNLETVIYDVMHQFDINIDNNRIEYWALVYNEWKKLHTKRVEWCWYFDEIMNAVLDGYDMDLVRFDLDLFQEATIQHELIYKHNLNLKTFELYKFKNTKQLHNLLEPNIHDLSKSKIYDN